MRQPHSHHVRGCAQGHHHSHHRASRCNPCPAALVLSRERRVHGRCGHHRTLRRPQVFGVTRDPFIVYTSNIFAILSLRALYGFVATVMSELRFLDKSVALVLGFIGVPATMSRRCECNAVATRRLHGMERIPRGSELY